MGIWINKAYYTNNEDQKEHYMQGLRNANFTQRQFLIINDKCPDVRRNEVTTLI